jgi:hypothetical protein
MSWMSYVMDGVLITLLLAALWFGARLNKQLKTLRAGQEDFARAVADLDRAAISAHVSLKELRKDADESQDLLHGRIMAGRDILLKLEQQLTRAERQMHEIDAAIAARAAVLANSSKLQRAEPQPARSEAPLVFRSPAAQQSSGQQSSGAKSRPEDDDNYNPAWATPKKTAAVRAAPRDNRAPFDRDVVQASSQLPPRRRFDEQQATEEAEMLEKVQMSELVVANLNEMIRSLGMPKRQPVTLEQDLFGEDAE